MGHPETNKNMQLQLPRVQPKPFRLCKCCQTVLWSLFYYLTKFTPLRLAHNESSQYTLTSKIDDQVRKVADCEAGTGDETARAVKQK